MSLPISIAIVGLYLPVAQRLVEDEVDKFGRYFLAELVLDVDKQLVGVEVAIGRYVDVVAQSFINVVDVMHSNRDGKPSACGVGVITYCLWRQAIVGDFSLKSQVAVGVVDLLKASLLCHHILQFVLEHLLQWWIDQGCTNGKVGKRHSLVLVVVD